MSGAPPRLLDRLMAVMQARRPTTEPCVPRSRSPITFTLPGRPIGKPMRDSSCRTAALGGRVEACDDCGGRRIAYNSCQNRHCPKCQGAAARVWLAEREADLFPVGYFHVFFTSPAEVAVIAFYNKALVYDLLFKAPSETTLTIAAAPKNLGACIGITAVLHTWGSAITHHPHVHMIVPSGGIALMGHAGYRHRCDRRPAGRSDTQNLIAQRRPTVGYRMGGFRAPDGTRNP